MKKTLKMILATMALGMGAGSLMATTSTESAQFLGLGLQARAASLGEAYAGFGQDLASLEYNPAGLAGSRPAYSVGYQSFVADINGTYAAGSTPLWGGMAAVSGRYIDFGTVQDAVMDAQGQVQMQSALHPSAFAGTLGFAREVSGGLSLGLAGTYFSQQVGPSQVAGGSFSMGLRESRLMVPGLSAGASVNRLGFSQENLPLPTEGRAGLGWNSSLPGLGGLGLASDLIVQGDGTSGLAAGMEWSPVKSLAARAGYNSITAADTLDGMSGLSFGFGMKLASLSFDYAYAPMGTLGATQRFTLTWAAR